MIAPHKILLCLSVFALAACAGPNLEFGPEPTTTAYTEASSSGLSPVRPFPTPDDVCQVIREDDAIREPVDDGTFLIACPKHERGAIGDRLEEGATVIGHARHWTVFAMPAPR